MVTDSMLQEYFTRERSRSNQCRVLFNTEFKRYQYPGLETGHRVPIPPLPPNRYLLNQPLFLN